MSEPDRMFYYIQPCYSDMEPDEDTGEIEELVGVALPQDATFWGVYQRNTRGISFHITDFDTGEAALEQANVFYHTDTACSHPVMVRMPTYTGSCEVYFVKPEDVLTGTNHRPTNG